MPIQGSLSTMPVPELLMWISQCQKTGTLEIRSCTWKEIMAFENGALIFSSSSNPDRTLGRLLMKHGIVTEAMHKQGGQGARRVENRDGGTTRPFSQKEGGGRALRPLRDGRRRVHIHRPRPSGAGLAADIW